METLQGKEQAAQEVLDSLQQYLAQVGKPGSPVLRPGHRVKFHWPPHPVSYDYHVGPELYTQSTTFSSGGDTFEVRVARTDQGVFGRCEELWLESMGPSQEVMLKHMAKEADPLLKRQRAIGRIIGLPGRFRGHIRDLPPKDLVKLLYCDDRDVAHDASVEIETHASLGVFTLALIAILRDQAHPNRRSAQWCVLDLFEDVTSFCSSPAQQLDAVEAILDLMWSAPDDYARTTFKAGVVLGGHLPFEYSGPVLIQCLDAPSKYGRLSAMHGLFHVVEWNPDKKEEALEALAKTAKNDSEPLLREFAAGLYSDIERGLYDHLPEPDLGDPA